MASILQSPRLASQIATSMFAKMQMAVRHSKAERGMSCYAEQKTSNKQREPATNNKKNKNKNTVHGECPASVGMVKAPSLITSIGPLSPGFEWLPSKIPVTAGIITFLENVDG